MKNIDVSVIMSVYNTPEKYLKESINSILQQSLDNFEFIIVDDGSNEKTKNILRSYEDSRIKILNNVQNMGLTKSLNIALQHAKGKYIARMDSDDVAMPQRLLHQFDYMENHLAAAVLGCYTKGIGTNRIGKQHWTSNIEVNKIRLLFNNHGIVHPTAFFRKSFLDNEKIVYDESILKAQDYAMWIAITKAGGEIHILPEVQLEYRVHDGQISMSKREEQDYFKNVIIKRQLRDYGFELSEKEIENFYRIDDGTFQETVTYIEGILNKLIMQNNKLKVFSKTLLDKEIMRLWTIAAIKRYKILKRIDMFTSKKVIEILKPINFFYICHYFIIEGYWGNKIFRE